MRVLRLGMLHYDCSTLWIFHLEDGKMNGKDRVRTTISSTEMERLKSNLQAVFTIVRKGEKRGLQIEWCRFNCVLKSKNQPPG
jgi:hypothetical protein